jgi:signal peptidase I
MLKFTRLLLVLIVAAAAMGCVSAARMDGESMLPAIKNGDRIFIVAQGEIKRGDIVSFLYPRDKKKIFLKRVIGLPGEKVEFTDGKVKINGEVIEEPYLDPQLNARGDNDRPEVSIPSDEYFVMGDNRDNSADSRMWGNVNKDLILGKYYMTYWESGKE